MELENVLNIQNRTEFRQWLENNHLTAKQCWVHIKRGKPVETKQLWYLDAVEEALCFGWIDSTCKVAGGRQMQRFSPRLTRTWTELNKERVRRLERMGMMTDAGRRVLPQMGERSFRIDPDVEASLKAARVWSKFRAFPPLYQRIRAYNVAFCKKSNEAAYMKSLSHLITETRAGRMYGEWNDYGCLIDKDPGGE